MKKSLFVIFASVLFVFNGSAQCNVPITQIVEYDFLSDFPIGGDTVYCYNEILDEIISNVQGGSGVYSYKWYFTTDINLLNHDLLNSPATWTLINGATNSNYTPPPITQSIRYKRVTTDVNCPALTRNDFTFVYHLYKVDQIEAIQKTCSPSIEAASIIDHTADPLWKNTADWYTIQWEYSDSETGVFIPISGATNFIYLPPNIQNTIYYRRKYSLDPYSHYGGTCNVQLSNAVAINPVMCSTFSSAITGPASVVPHQTSIYSVDESVELEYDWTVWGGDIVSGQGTNTITVLWGEYYPPIMGGRTNGVTLKETDIFYTSNYTYLHVAIAATTGINKGFASSGVSVFPNPIKNQFTVEMPTANTAVNYTVYSTTGVQMQSGSFSAAASGNTISTQLPAGMYQLVLNYDGVFTSSRLVVSGQ